MSSTRRTFRHSAAVTALALLSACFGNTLGNLPLPSPGGEAPLTPAIVRQVSEGMPKEKACKSNKPGERSVRRLTNNQFTKSLATALSTNMVPKAEFFGDMAYQGLKNHADKLLIQDVMAKQISDYIDSLAEPIKAAPTAWKIACNTVDQACADAFVAAAANKVFRGVAPKERLAAYSQLFLTGKDFDDAVNLTTSAMLQSPYFLYRLELGNKGDDGLYKLTSPEIASLLSYFLTNAPPDEELLADAQADKLQDSDTLNKHAQRLLAKPENQKEAVAFFFDWLYKSPLADVVRADPEMKFTPELRSAKFAQAQATILDVAFTQQKGIKELITGGAAPTGGQDNNGNQATPMQPGNMPGLLGQVAWNAANAAPDHSSPTIRGYVVRTRMLCDDVPPPPKSNIPPFTDVMKLQIPTRDKFMCHLQPDLPYCVSSSDNKTRLSDSVCANCHEKMDPIGFAFENFDELGNFRAMEAGKNIDSSGHITNIADKSKTEFKDFADFTQKLAENPQLQRCTIRYFNYDAFGLFAWDEDGCTIDSIDSYAKGKDYAFQSIIEGIIKSETFTKRTTPSMDGMPSNMQTSAKE